MNKKSIAVTAVIALVIASLSGCGKSSTTSSSTVSGEVTAINSDSIVMNVMNRPDGVSGGAIKGNPPDGASGAAIKNGGNNGQKPDGTPPADMKDNKDANAKNGNRMKGEEKTIKITDSTTVTVNNGQESTTGSISDVSLGSMVEVGLDSDGETAVSITVNSGNNFGGKGQTKTTK